MDYARLIPRDSTVFGIALIGLIFFALSRWSDDLFVLVTETVDKGEIASMVNVEVSVFLYV